MAVSRRVPLFIFRRFFTRVSVACIAILPVAADGQAKLETSPIHRLARLFNPELVKIESRLDWIEQRISTMASYHEHPLRVGIGARGHRLSHDAPDPVVRLDLGAVHTLERVFLIPAQREYIGDVGTFPVRFTIEVAAEPDFSGRTVIHSSGNDLFPNPEGRPIAFDALKTPARYLRLTVHSGHNSKGWIDLFGLAEIVATNEFGEAVSFNAGVEMDDALDSGAIWYPEALTDGRMPYGIWHSGLTSDERGDATLIGEGSPVVSWTLRLDAPAALDRVVLFPYKLTTSFESSLVPNRLLVQTRTGEKAAWHTVATWHNNPVDSNCLTPLVICLRGTLAGSVRITATEPWCLGDMKIQGLSEIEVWSGGRNIARDLTVMRSREHVLQAVDSLTNGFTSDHMIAAVPVWLDQLHERLRLEKELSKTRPQASAMAAESEVIATMGGAIFMSLVFLIPVFYVEHRRTRNARRLDELRRRIASDLHDDIGGNLGSISLIARTARKEVEKLQAPAELAYDLDEVESIARESSLAMRDIVWLLERRNDSVGDLVHRMRETSARLLRGIEYSLVCLSTRTDLRLSLDCKRHLFLFHKEALHNICKHAAATQVTILLDDDGDHLVLEIQDNGVGMPQGSTARKLRDRAAIIGAGFSISSAEGTGTCIRLALRSKLLNSNPGIT